jgi:phosphatidylserine/phosphatidylglycerophosphate/cardiolipin synthase-like enzyme
MPDHPATALGRLLARSQARALADRFEAGATVTAALNAVPPGVREAVRGAVIGLAPAGASRAALVATLLGIEGAQEVAAAATTIWTMPGFVTQSSGLTASTAHLRPGVVLRSKPFEGAPVRNHAKFIVIDHRFSLVTSANFSWSAERRNIELGVLLDDRAVADRIESEMRDAEAILFKTVSCHAS